MAETKKKRFDFEVLRPLLSARPREQEMMIGTGRRIRAVCTACGGTDRMMMMKSEKHSPDCGLIAYYDAVRALEEKLRQ